MNSQSDLEQQRTFSISDCEDISDYNIWSSFLGSLHMNFATKLSFFCFYVKKKGVFWISETKVHTFFYFDWKLIYPISLSLGKIKKNQQISAILRI